MKNNTIITLITACFISVVSFAQSVNQFDKNGKRHGKWKKFYSNNQVRYEGQFNHGKEVGVFLFYDEKSDGKPSIMKKFEENSSISEVMFFFPSGKRKSEGKMDYKNRIGTWTYYFSDGLKVLSTENYKDGLLDGISITYDRTGVIIDETSFSKGKKEGLQKKYTDKKKLVEVITYKNGKRNGEASFYDNNGNLIKRGNYLDDKKVGKWTRYKNGKIIGTDYPNKKKEKPQPKK
ncbi:toxin-antitoxin system YwqK family antitoxin [Aureivirga sp. CE67]|uniref:toxin-antitoxin system YwqK family antitoxin n=1 Tax=Aureivirga sp. CE67 TaxID=1788983 RepID=UPI0018C9A0E3|nr:toxin-antitoxin system YwqK family antitoxin [Aureivirga sp. CE67]